MPTITTTASRISDGSAPTLALSNAGPAPVRVYGAGGVTVKPGASLRYETHGEPTWAVTLSGTASLTVDLVGVGGGGVVDPTLFADRTLSNLSDVEEAQDNLQLGSAASRDIGTGAGTVAAGDDLRLSDSRTPTAHAASHASGGGDAVTVAQAQVSGLTASLAAKADLSGGKVPSDQLPALAISGEQDPYPVNSQAEMLALDATNGAVAIRADLGKSFILQGDDASQLGKWFEIVSVDGVQSVAGRTGVVVLTTGDVGGLSAALAAKADTSALDDKADTDDLGDAALLDVGTTAGTVAAGDDSRITGAAQRAGGNTFTGTQDFTGATVLGIAAEGSGGTLPFVIVAASNAPSVWKAAASYTCDGTDDAAEINNVINALTTHAGGLGGTVILSPGTFTIGKTSPTQSGTTVSNSDSAVQLRSDVNLVGQGMGVTILKLRNNFTQGITGILRTYDSSTVDIARITVRDLTIDGNLANQPTGASPRHIGFYLGAAKQGGKWVQDVLVERVEVKNCRSYAFDPHERSRRLTFRSCVAHDNGIMGSANTYEQCTGITVDWCTDTVIEDCKFWKNSDHGIELVTDARRCIVRGNHSFSNGTTGIVLQRGTPDTTTLGASIASTGATSITISEQASLLGSPANGVTGDPNYVIRVGTEEMVVTATSGTTMTVTRGAYGTTAATHSNGATISRVGWVDTVTGVVARSSDYNTIAGNRVWGNGAQGIKVTGHRNVIVGNDLSFNCLTASGLELDIAGTATSPTFGGTYNHVADNRIMTGNVAGTVRSGSANLATYALGESNSACNWNTFSNNHVEGSPSTAVTRIQGVNSALVAAYDDFVTTAEVGQPDGVAELDAAGVIVAAQVAGLPPESFGAARAQHSHGLSDLPDVTRVLGSAWLVIPYDEDAEQWSATRASLALKPGQAVLWVGDAEPPADADEDDWHAFDAAAVPLPPVDPPDPPSATRDENGVVLNAPTVTVTGQTASLTALLNTDAALTFQFLQFAIRRTSDNLNQDAGHTQNLAVNGDYTLSASKASLPAGSYTAHVAYSLNGTVWKDGPTADFTIVSAPTTGPTLIGRSGLPFNAGVFYQNGTQTAANDFGTWRNRPVDSIMYFVGRTGATVEQAWSAMSWLRDDLTDWPGYRVIAIPSQPQGQSNHATAAGTNNAWWTAYGQALKNKGWDDGRTIIRLNWECNGTWYDWAWGNTSRYTTAGDAISAFTGSWLNVVNSVRSRAPKTLFDCNINRGNVRSGVNFWTDILGPIEDHVDIIGLDWYNHAPAQTSQGEFDSTAASAMSGEVTHAWCVDHDKVMSIDEWFPSHGHQANGIWPAGGDDPAWISRMFTWMSGKAVGNGGRLFQEISYNDTGAPPELRHKLFGPSENPLSSARYIQTDHWGRA